MSWTRLYPLPVESFVSPKLGKEVEKLNKEIQRVLEIRGNIGSERDKLRQTDVKEINFDDLVLMPCNRANALTCMQEELKVRERIAELLQAIREECGHACTAAGQTHAERREEVRAALTRIGYPPAAEPDPLPPIFLQRHPEVVAAYRRINELQQRFNARDWDTENETAAETVVAQLTWVRDAV